jgi:N6-adenosine-specific RNA methylase IME4
VAALAPLEADELLDKAEANRWSQKELRAAVSRRAENRRMGLAAQEAPALEALGRFQVVLADPPWTFEDDGSASRGILNHYETMPLEDICALEVPAAQDAVLFLWAPSPKVMEAGAVITAWGFSYRTHMVWDKGVIGMGHYARQQTEDLLIARRGGLPVPAPENRPSNLVYAPRGEHSAKPEIFYDLIEQMYPGLSKVELFARSSRPGWTAWGNQAPIEQRRSPGCKDRPACPPPSPCSTTRRSTTP